jgi:CRP-like cAMP-binding protein
LGNQGHRRDGVPATKRDPTTNHLLAALPAGSLQRAIEGCEPVDLAFGEVLCRRGDRIRHVYFPTDSFISLIAQVDRRGGIEVGMVGREGMFGVGLLLGVEFSPMHGLVQGAGPALRMSAKRFLRELREIPALRPRMNRYVQVLLSQLAQNAACTRFHLVEARLARWLLMTSDRASSEDFYLTQQFLSHMLGVRRVGVTAAASSLQKGKLIDYKRGVITILDRRGLQAAACECYAADKKVYARIMK